MTSPESQRPVLRVRPASGQRIDAASDLSAPQPDSVPALHRSRVHLSGEWCGKARHHGVAAHARRRRALRYRPVGQAGSGSLSTAHQKPCSSGKSEGAGRKAPVRVGSGVGQSAVGGDGSDARRHRRRWSSAGGGPGGRRPGGRWGDRRGTNREDHGGGGAVGRVAVLAHLVVGYADRCPHRVFTQHVAQCRPADGGGCLRLRSRTLLTTRWMVHTSPCCRCSTPPAGAQKRPGSALELSVTVPVSRSCLSLLRLEATSAGGFLRVIFNAARERRLLGIVNSSRTVVTEP